MKNSFRVKLILTMFFGVLACLPLIFSSPKIVYAAIDNEVESSAIYYEGSVSTADAPAGKTKGYGSFVLGATDRTLTSTAYAGYKIVGWQVTYLETDLADGVERRESVVIQDENSVLKTKSGTEVNVNIDYSDDNEDGYCDKSTLKLAQVFEDLKVVPLFDYIYYQLNVNSIVKLGLPNNSINVGSDVVYTSTENPESASELNDVIIKIKENYFYYGKLYVSDGKYFTLHDGQEVAYDRGAFRLNENVKISQAVDFNKDDVGNGVNIDVKGFKLNNVALVYSTENVDNSFLLTKDETYKLTTNFSVNLKIENVSVNTLEIDYHELQIAKLNVFIDDVKQNSGDALSQILSVVFVENYFSKISENEYFVKKSQDTSFTFYVVCAENYSVEIDDHMYYYFNFTSLDGKNNIKKEFNNINDDFEINIKYSSVEYSVNFKFVDVSNGEFKIDNDKDIHDSISLKRGDTFDTLEGFVVRNCAGYSFKGFADESHELDDKFLYTLDNEKPKSQTIYLCYEKIEYVLRLCNINKKELIDTNGNKVYALNKLYLLKDSEIRETVLDSDVVLPTVLSEYSFETRIRINENISFDAIVNPGFENLKFTFALNGADTIYLENNLFVFDEEFIELASIVYDETNGYYYLPIFVVEDYAYYTLTYYTQLTHDHLVNENVVMANLSINPADNANYEYQYLTVQNIKTEKDSEDLAKIVVSKIKYYEVLTLQSSGKSDFSGNNYVFVMFTEDDKSSLANAKIGDLYIFTTSPINRDIAIKVVYTVPVASVNVVVDSDMENAYSGISITQAGKEVVLDDELKVFKLTVGLDLTISVEMNFGYKIVGYELTVNGETTALSSNDAIYTLEKVERALPHIVRVKFEIVKYNFYFTQIGGGVDNEKVSFNDGSVDYLALDVESRKISFSKPTGYYVNSTKFVVSVGTDSTEIECPELNESNDNRHGTNSNIYSYEFEKAEFITVVTNYQTVNAGQVEVHIKISYEIYMYDVSVKYVLENWQNGVVFPEINLEYGDDHILQESTYNSEDKTLVFQGIPYGAKISLKVSNEIQTGLAVVGWRNSVGNELEAELFDKIEATELLTKFGIGSDRSFIYKLSYTMYKLSLNYDATQGLPKIDLNGEENVDLKNIQIKLFDNFVIYANPTVEMGYIFDNFYKSSDSLETLDESKIDGEIYEEDKFNVENYEINGTTLTIYLRYDLMRISIKNISENFEKNKHLNGKGTKDSESMIQILKEDYASYVVESRQNDDDAWGGVDWQNGGTVSAKDIVKITIQVNKNAINQYDNKVYDLTLGVILHNNIKIAGQAGWQYTGGTDGKYFLEFEVGKFIKALNTENPVMNIEYRYEMAIINIGVTTNITSEESFYSNISLIVDGTFYGFSNSSLDSSGSSRVESDMQFLAMSHATYQWEDVSYSNHFRISNVEIKDKNGVKIENSDYASRGIQIKYKDAEGLVIDKVVVRYFENLTIIFQITPIILYDNKDITSDYEFSSYYNCDIDGNGKEQTLTVETNESANIFCRDQKIVDSMIITYTNSKGIKVNAPVDCGVYTINIDFNADTYKWLADIELQYDITWAITPRPIIVSYVDNFEKTSKIYDGLSSYNTNEALHLLRLVDGVGTVLNVAYVKSNSQGGFSFVNDKSNSSLITITVNGEQVEIKKANENVYYNISIKNLRLSTSNSFNDNFMLMNDSVVVPEYIKVMKRQVVLENLNVYNKVEDGTKSAKYDKNSVKISDTSKIVGDELYIDAERVKIEFENSSVGKNKNVLIDASKSLTGADADNYYVAQSVMTDKTIYPYKVSFNIKEIGKVSLINKLGLEKYEYVDLIPVGAELKVETIVYDSVEYTNIYRHIAKHFNRGNKFGIGYKISLWLDGQEIEINKNLFLAIPTIEELTDVVYLTGEQSNKLDYYVEDGQVIINLNQINEDVDSIILLKSRSYMKWWQILIIILSLILILIAIIIVVMIIRRRKAEKYSINEKI